MSEQTINPFDLLIFKNWIGLIGNALAIVFFVAPISLMIKLHKKEQDPEKIPYLIMLMNVMNCILWLSYGIIINDYFIIFGNALGYLMNLIYLCLYFYYRFEKNFLIYSLLNVSSVCISLSLFLLLTFIIVKEDISKYSAMFFNILMYGAPGQKILEVFKTKDHSLIPLPYTMLALFCSTTWLIYGILPKLNISIIIPNGIGLSLSVINFFTFLYFYKLQQPIAIPDGEACVLHEH